MASFCGGVDAVHVERGVRLGEPVRLRVGEDLRERLPLARHAREDVVARPVDDPGDAPDPVRDEPAADRVDERDAAADAPLEPERDALPLRLRDELLPVRREERLVGGDDVLAVLHRREDEGAGRLDAADELDDHLHLGVVHDLVRVGREDAGREAELLRARRVAVRRPRQLERDAEAPLDERAVLARISTVPAPMFPSPRIPTLIAFVPLLMPVASGGAVCTTRVAAGSPRPRSGTGAVPVEESQGWRIGRAPRSFPAPARSNRERGGHAPIPFAGSPPSSPPTPRVPTPRRRSRRWGPYSVEAVDEWGGPLPTFEHRGRTHVLGVLGQRYLLRFRNQSGRRVEVVASVDGRDVVDGRPAAFEKRGYVVEPYGELTIDGYRLSQAAVAAFRFSSVAQSYAARKGDARDVGVVGVAVFAERRPRHVLPPPFRPSPDRSAAPPTPTPRRRGQAARIERRGVVPHAGGRRPRRESRPTPARPSDPGSAPSSAKRASRSSTRPFRAGELRPEALLTFRYDNREGLLALGVDVDGERGHRGVTGLATCVRLAVPRRRRVLRPAPGWRVGVR